MYVQIAKAKNIKKDNRRITVGFVIIVNIRYGIHKDDVPFDNIDDAQ